MANAIGSNRHFKPDQLALLRNLGFYNPSINSCTENPDTFVGANDTNRQTAFHLLASLGGRPKVIDINDLICLDNPKSLAKIIESDPVYKIIVDHERALEFGKQELLQDRERTAISPRDYRRFLTYVQLALNKFVTPELEPNGTYDTNTYRAVRLFQTKTNILPDYVKDLGLIMGVQTLNTIVMRLKYSKKEIVKMLEADRDFMNSTEEPLNNLNPDNLSDSIINTIFQPDQNMDTLIRKTKASAKVIIRGYDQMYLDKPTSGRKETVQQDVITALIWLGYFHEPRIIHKDSPNFRNKDAGCALTRNFGGANLVGPKLIGRIIDRVIDSEPLN